MSHNFNLQVFVSCPSDVNEEKEMVHKACERANKTLLSLDAKVQLIFRDFTEIIGAIGKRPQQIINDEITGYNIFIGILYMRFGTPTGSNNPVTGQPFESGTEEEFFIATQKKQSDNENIQTYFFFKTQTGVTNSQSGEQAIKVLKFKERLMAHDWVNSFTTPHEFENTISDLLIRIAFKVHLDSLKQTRKAFEESTSIKLDKTFFVPQLPKLAYYIARSVVSFLKSPNMELLGEKINKTTLLKDVLLQKRKIVLLGNAGSGKSIELQQLAWHFQKEDTPFIPLYRRLNTFSGDDIKSYLPTGYDQVDSDILLILLDGLDEIQPHFFNNAVSKLIEFAELNPKVRMVITCRTNFYEPPNENFSGTLTGFEPYLLNDISVNEIKSYAITHLKTDGAKLVLNAYEEGFLDLILKPFFLNILLKHYIEKGNFRLGRARIIEEFIFSRINLDKEHYKTTIAVNRTKSEILVLVEKVAFVMEVMGKNFVNDEELLQILENKEDFNQIKYFTAFTKDIHNNQWIFEHNNIQEFLASKVLTRLSFQKLIETITFAPSYQKVKPTWVNTISFFISIGNAQTVKMLVDWLVDKDREIIIKFEPDRIDSELRINLFKQIFNFYKCKNIWLSSNKFNDNELSRFASFPQVLDFLITEINNTNNTRIVRLNAIGVFNNFELKEFEPRYKQIAKESLLKILDDEVPDSPMIHSILYAMAKSNITDEKTVRHIIHKYRHRTNQYIRAGMYKYLSTSIYLDEYIDVFIQGFDLSEIEGAIEDRGEVNLMDESLLLKEGLVKMKDPKAIKKIFKIFKRPLHDIKLYADEQSDILKGVLQNSFEAYRKDASILNEIIEVYKSIGKSYDQYYAKIIIPFFEQTEKKWEVFQQLWLDEKEDSSSKNFLLNLLIDGGIVQQFVQGYMKRDFTNIDVSNFYHLMYWHYTEDHPDFKLLEAFPERIYQLTGFKINIPDRKDWKLINAIRNQKSFDILFDKELMITEINNVFAQLEKKDLDSEDLWSLRKANIMTDIDAYFPASALELLQDFTMYSRRIDYNTAKDWIEQNSRFEDFQLEKIYHILKRANKEAITVSDAQMKFITEWCNQITEKIDLKKAAKPIEIDENYLSIDPNAQKLWFFIRRFNILIAEDKLLNFTLFYDPEKQSSNDDKNTITELEAFVSKEKITDKVIINLEAGITTQDAWKTNAAYAISNNVKAAFPFILAGIKDFRRYENFRRDILERFFDKTKDTKALQDLLAPVGTDQLRWDIVEILVKVDNHNNFLLHYLKGILANSNELYESKIDAARYLVELNDLEGFNFLVHQILENKDTSFNYSYRLHSFSAIRKLEAIPLLLELLAFAKQPEFQKDKFNSLESATIDALYKIGIYSEENFIAIKNAIEKFIDTNHTKVPHYNFLYFQIQRIEEQLYMNKSKSYSLKEAIREFKDLQGVNP